MSKLFSSTATSWKHLSSQDQRVQAYCPTAKPVTGDPPTAGFPPAKAFVARFPSGPMSRAILGDDSRLFANERCTKKMV